MMVHMIIRKEIKGRSYLRSSMFLTNQLENPLAREREEMHRPIMPHSISPSPSPSTFHQLQISSLNQSISSSIFFLGSSILLVVCVVLIVIFWICYKSSALNQILVRNNRVQGMPDFFSGNLRTISYFSYRTLKKVTGNFNPDNLLGRGGFGPVYKGVLEDGRMIAVKKLALEKSRQGEEEFLTEVRMITSIHHKNLVQLLGCCSDGPQRLLVYEYMVNGSLDAIVHGRSDHFLDWKRRFQIILGIARGLQYLHEDSHVRIIHRDIKASNILLDDKFQPRIGDFGLARFFPEDQAYLSTTFGGTLGYTAPEYAIRGELSEKADIYSFGVLVLEIISCRKNADPTLASEMQYLPEYAWKLYNRSRIIDLVDPKLQSDGFNERDVLLVFHVAMLCLQPHPSLRPRMSEIVTILTSKAEMLAEPMKPAFLDQRRQYKEFNSWETRCESFSSYLPNDSPSYAHRSGASNQRPYSTSEAEFGYSTSLNCSSSFRLGVNDQSEERLQCARPIFPSPS